MIHEDIINKNKDIISVTQYNDTQIPRVNKCFILKHLKENNSHAYLSFKEEIALK